MIRATVIATWLTITLQVHFLFYEEVKADPVGQVFIKAKKQIFDKLANHTDTPSRACSR